MFYVYVYRDPRPTKNNQPVYVGKGKGDRDLSHWSKGSRNKPFQNLISLLKKSGMVAPCERVFETEDEQEAFAKERELIALYGRRDLGTGTLFNLTDGGEGLSNAIRTDEWKKNISLANSSPENVRKSSKRQREKWANPDFRKKHTAAIRVAIARPEVAAKREAAKALFNKTDAFRDTVRKATTKMWQDPAYAEKVVAAQKEVQGTPEARANKSSASKETWAKPEVRTKRQQGIKAARSSKASKDKTSAQAKAQWADPEYAAKQTANNKEIANREEVKAAKSAASKAKWADPVWKAKMLAARAKNKQEKISDVCVDSV